MHSVSVIIPAKDRQTVLPRAIESALAQSYKAAEIIVVDDGSSDSTSNVALSYPGVRLLSNLKSVGAASARNLGAESAQGDLLAFLDSDDSWAPDKLARQCAILTRHTDTPAVFSGVRFIMSDPNGTKKAPIVPPRLVMTEDLLHGNLLGTVSTAMIRSDSFRAVGGFDGGLRSCQDWDLWIRLSDIGPLRTDPGPLVNYYDDATGRISVNPDSILSGHDAVLAKILKRPLDARRKRRIRSELYRRLSDIFSTDIRLPAQSLNYAWRSLLADPSTRSFVQPFRALIKSLR